MGYHNNKQKYGQQKSRWIDDMYGEREVVPTREKKTERNRFHKNETVSIFLIFQQDRFIIIL